MCIDDNFCAPDVPNSAGWASFAVWKVAAEQDWYAGEKNAATQQRLTLLGDLLACLLLFVVIWHCYRLVTPAPTPQQHQCAIKPWQHSLHLIASHSVCLR